MARGLGRVRAVVAAGAPLTLALTLALTSLACRSGPNDGFALSFAAGARAYHAGRYDEAAARYRDAALRADRLKDRDEGFFMEARMRALSGARGEAIALYDALVALSPDGPRRVRAQMAAAELALEGSPADGERRLAALVAAHPDHNLGQVAALRLASLADERGGVEARLARLEELASKVPAGPRGLVLAESLAYHRARALRDAGRRAEARDAFVACARKYPYPKGNYADDALFFAAELERELGRPREAVALLRELLAPRESSHAMGSYERPRFSAAQELIAHTLRALGDRAGARRELHQLYVAHPTSTRRDDALWWEAKLFREDGLERDACAVLSTLVRELPESRYAPCAPTLCPALAAEVQKGPLAKRECHAYLLRDEAPSDD